MEAGRIRPGLLVSVRSAPEARAACRGGATVIDVKEPARGPLGRADAPTWRAVRAVVPEAVPVSVALGELSAMLADLAPQDRAALVLVAVEGLTAKAAAEALGCSEGAVEQRLVRARAALRSRQEREEARSHES